MNNSAPITDLLRQIDPKAIYKTHPIGVWSKFAADWIDQLERELAEAKDEVNTWKAVAEARLENFHRYHDESLAYQAQLTAHKAALEKCEHVISILNEDGGYLHSETSGLCYHCAGTGGSLASVVHNEGCPQPLVDEALSEIAKLKGTK